MKHPNTGLRDVLATAADITRTADRAGIQITQMSASRYGDDEIGVHLADVRRASDLIEALDVEVEKVQNFPGVTVRFVTVNQIRVVIYGAPVEQVTA